jgi:hypothetical protein
MPIPLDTLRRAAARPRPQHLAKSLHEALAKAQQTAFLCHSHRDGKLAEGLQRLLVEQGWNVYIDWQDSAMPPEPDRETAERIRRKIRERGWFLFLATPNSTGSRWCPWEIGYADSTKPHNQILLVCTSDNSGNWYGNEYLQLYREITYTKGGRLAAYPEGKTTGGVLVENLG